MGLKDSLDIAASVITVCGFIFAVFKWLQFQERRQAAVTAPPPQFLTSPPQPNWPIDYGASPSQIVLRYSLIGGCIASPVSFVTTLLLINGPFQLQPMLAWLGVASLPPLLAGFATVWNTRRISYGVAAGILVVTMYAVIAGLTFEIGIDDSSLGNHLVNGTLLVAFAFMVGLLPSITLAAIGGLAAKSFKRHKL